MNSAMIDIETLGVTPGSSIVSIGVVVFNKRFETVQEEAIYVNISQSPLKIEPDTLLWWLGQCSTNQKLLKGFSELPRYSLASSLERLSLILSSLNVQEFWAKPSTFDFPLLEYAYKIVGKPIPWNHRQVRCLRTLWNHYGLELLDFVGDPHDCLDDARNQVNCLRVIANHVKQNNDKLECYDELKTTLDTARLEIERLKDTIRDRNTTIIHLKGKNNDS